jgi:hypothetical protein
MLPYTIVKSAYTAFVLKPEKMWPANQVTLYRNSLSFKPMAEAITKKDGVPV